MNTPTTIELRAALAYGQVRYYPSNPQAQAICTLTGRQTITRKDINLLRELGFTVHVKADQAIAQALAV